MRGGLLLREQLLPGGPQYSVRADALNQALVQLMHQAIALRLVDHEGEVQVVRSLGHQIDLLILEQFKGRSELMQDAANIVAQQAQGGAGSQDLDAAQCPE